MSGYLTGLASEASRARAVEWVMRAPRDWFCVVRPPARTLDQNNKLWAMLTDISVAKPLGRRHTPDDWKAIAMNACSWECAFLEGLDGRPFPIGFRSSKLSKTQMSTLIDWLQAFGDEHGVRWTDEAKDAA